MATLARVIEARHQETIEVLEDAPKPPPKGQHRVRKAKYTLAELLSPETPETADAGDVASDPVFAHLPAALL